MQPLQQELLDTDTHISVTQSTEPGPVPLDSSTDPNLAKSTQDPEKPIFGPGFSAAPDQVIKEYTAAFRAKAGSGNPMHPDRKGTWNRLPMFHDDMPVAYPWLTDNQQLDFNIPEGARDSADVSEQEVEISLFDFNQQGLGASDTQTPCDIALEDSSNPPASDGSA